MANLLKGIPRFLSGAIEKFSKRGDKQHYPDAIFNGHRHSSSGNSGLSYFARKSSFAHRQRLTLEIYISAMADMKDGN